MLQFLKKLKIELVSETGSKYERDIKGSNVSLSC